VPGIRQSGSQWVGKLLTAADSVGLKVALGLFEADGPAGNCMTGLDPSDPTGSLSALASVYSAVARDLASQYGHHASLRGFYLPLELSNVCLPTQPELAGSHFLEPAAKTIKSLGLVSSCSLALRACWLRRGPMPAGASSQQHLPYMAGEQLQPPLQRRVGRSAAGGPEQSRAEQRRAEQSRALAIWTGMRSAQVPATVASWWAAVVAAAPSLDRIEMQDKRSMNPLATTLRFMRALSAALAGKITLWSNAEAFRAT
jgi:hypothetical protein